MKFQYQSIGTLFLLLVTLTACSECEGEVRDSLDSGILQDESADLDGGIADTVLPDGGTAPIVDLDAGVVGFFETGQAANQLLAGQGFNETGGADLFNHPKGLASDGTRLIMCDGNNNRVLIWTSLPDDPTDAPDLVLGQPDFNQNNPGTNLGQMNWPVSVTIAPSGSPLIVADSYNNRLLVWTTFPTANGQAADYSLQGMALDEAAIIPRPTPAVDAKARGNFVWPWGVWTDGEKLLVSSTARSTYGNVHFGGWVLVWNSFDFNDATLTGEVLPPEPVSGTAASLTWQSADYYLNVQGDMGTPRTITSNGDMVLIGDHNAETVSSIPGTGEMAGNWVWSSFPTANDQAPDFFLSDPSPSIWMQGCFTDAGELVMVGQNFHVWQTPPSYNTATTTIMNESPSLTVKNQPIGLRSGDGSSLVCHNETVYLADYNGNRILVFNDLPTHDEDYPDFAIGSPYTLDTVTGNVTYSNSLDNNYFVTNPQLALNGDIFIVASAFDGRLLGFKEKPTDITTVADLDSTDNMWGISDMLLQDGQFFLVYGHGGASGMASSIRIWDDVDPNSTEPDSLWNNGSGTTLSGSLGSATFNELVSVAMDAQYFYLCDKNGPDHTVYVWERSDSDFYVSNPDPLFEIDAAAAGFISSDGEHLFMNSGNQVWYLDISTLSSASSPVALTDSGYGSSSLEQVLAYNGHLFISDKGYHRVLAWEDKYDAMAGDAPTAILGAADMNDFGPNIGEDSLFWPSEIAMEGTDLWVGEYKFSGRLVRFSP